MSDGITPGPEKAESGRPAPAHRLRDAATLMREHARAATSGPWEFRPRRGFQSMGAAPATIGFIDTAGYFVMLREGTWGTEGDMTYVASWPPEVALAVATSLEQAGADLWAHGLPDGCDACGGCDECDDLLYAPHVRRALAVADAYLGTEASSDV